MNFHSLRALSENTARIKNSGWMNINTPFRRHLASTIPRTTRNPSMQSIYEHFDRLNEQQTQAVLSPPTGALQILAGPGTGKTWVMALRVAKLILEDGIPPELIFMATFGRHPTQELRSRLNGLIGQELTGRLKLGTIHSICWKFIKGNKTPHASLWNDSMCRDMIRHIVIARCRGHTSEEVPSKYFLAQKVQLAVAKMKVYAGTRRSLLRLIHHTLKLRVNYDTFEQIIRDYQATMKYSNALDFDDLVNEFLELVRQKPSLVSYFRYILVDEFQDTNLAQYQLIRAITRASKSGITVVGDPDQTIYGWRFADDKNFRRMCADFPETRVTNLETNYRSTPSILNFSQAVIAQGKSRARRSLCSFRQHPAGPLPVLQQLFTIEEEASAVATHIQEMHHNSKGTLQYGNFAILLRYNSWKVLFGDILGRKKIPFQFLPNPNFYSKAVVLDLLAYIFLAFSRQDTPWLLRILDNIDSVDARTILSIHRQALDQKTMAMSIVQQMAYDDLYRIDPQVRAQFQRLVILLDYIKKEGRNGALPSQMLEYILRHTDFEEQLRKGERGYNFTELWSEVESLVHEAREFERSGMMGINSSRTPMSMYIDYVQEKSKEFQMFDTESVNIMTVHASKGLEFPVVFIPGGMAAFINSHLLPVYPRNTKKRIEYEEDRRLLYVGCTRAKSWLHLTYPEYEDGERAELSEFIDKIEPDLYQVT
ncbi:unnamed protein product [Rhizoctonia solani]|uniref:DNA 3'-5' helicase n=1 Tax=Rhizoctonia solani TaxID=456999 RepID=A0A8H3DR09_9AGAM|nr:unnamed protein product [Rhizoctonia solani]